MFCGPRTNAHLPQRMYSAAPKVFRYNISAVDLVELELSKPVEYPSTTRN